MLGAQGVYIPPKIPAKSCEALDEAVQASATGNIDKPIQTIRMLISKYPTWTLPRQQLSRIYYEAGNRKDAIETLEASIVIDTVSQLQQLYTLGRIYEENGEPARAVVAYKSVIRLGRDQPDLTERATKNLNALERKSNLWQTDIKITLTPLPPDINTPNEEYLGRWTLDGNELIFTRRLNHQDDLFIAKYDSNRRIVIEDVSFNSRLDEAAQTISPDGKYIVFTGCDHPDGLGSCDLYFSIKKDGVMTKPVNMGPAFNSPSWDSQPCFGLDGMSLFFSSSRPGGYGGRDIWVVRELPNGNWSRPVNAGSVINTADNEASPFIHFDGRTMYFMRDGDGGLGGYDLYFSRMDIEGQWRTPENMGAPINSGADEGALSLHPNGKTAIITRMTANQLNDLFEFQLPEKYQSLPMQELQVRVIDEKTKRPLKARLEVFEMLDDDTIRVSQWSDASGKISMAIEKNKNYGMITSSEGYIMNSTNLQPATEAIRMLEIEMTPLGSAAEKTIVLHNIFFSTGSATLLSNSKPELNKLRSTLVDHPVMKIEIRGHTDNVGTDEDNQQLSEARAKSVYQYLLDGGIDGSRLSYKGFGETQPVASNDNESGRRQNRRTEFKVVSSE